VRFCIHRATRLRRSTAALLAFGLVPIAAVSGIAQPATSPAESACAAGEAKSAIGQPYSPELADRSRRAAGAREVRKVEPGGAYTTDLDPSRLNIEVDRTGIVRDLRCG
jgi:hypothetical protein